MAKIRSLSLAPGRFSLSAIRRFAKDHRGVAAIEFAFAAPVLVVLYFGSMEISQAIEVNKKVGRISSMVADLMTQKQALTTDELKSIMEIGAATIKPYGRSEPTITATAIQLSDEATPKATEVWWGALAPGDQFTSGASATQAANPAVPTGLNVRNSFLIRVTAALPYKLVLTYKKPQPGDTGLGVAGFWSGIAMSETYYLRPRMSDRITCDAC